MMSSMCNTQQTKDALEQSEYISRRAAIVVAHNAGHTLQDLLDGLGSCPVEARVSDEGLVVINAEQLQCALTVEAK